MYDLKIKGGTLVDGTGKDRFTGDIGIKDGMIVDVGECPLSGQEEIDASGAIVTPGFTDIHTHYDGQISWDEEMAPSSLHGVTTAVRGRCGVGFAPCKEGDHERLIRLMEGVEDIPGSALAEGISWDWETFPEYMEALDRMPHTIDFACQIPHDVVRVFVMGDRAIAEQAASEEDMAAMRQIIREAIEAGAVGFSTGRSDNHRTADGQPTPASEATPRELVELAKAFVGLNKGVLQAVSDFNVLQGDDDFDREFDMLEAMVAAADGRPMSMSTMQRDHSPNQWKWIMQRAEKAAEKGLTIRCQVGARGIGVMLGLEATFHPFMGFPSYKRIHHLPLAERVKAMRDPEFKAQLLKEKTEPLAGDGSAIPPLADELLSKIDMVAMRLFRLGENPNYEPTPKDCLAAEAMRTGKPTLEVIYDALLEQEGKALLYFPLYNYTGMSLDTLHEMLTHPLALPGLSDGGAHVGTVCDASFPTFLMQHWARDRQKGRIPLEKIVKMQAHDTSAFLGMKDRGTIAAGMRADLNILDFDKLRLQHPEMKKDLPAGGQRLLQGADGYVATLVKGVAIAEQGKLTGARPGRLYRS